MSILCKFGLHKGKIVRDKGAWLYKECTRCDHRWAVSQSFGGGPLEHDWIAGGEFYDQQKVLNFKQGVKNLEKSRKVRGSGNS